jgi:hypothetical protein
MRTFPTRERIGQVCRLVAAAIGLLCATAPAALGQAETEARIIGVVTDQSGAVLPGVTVTAASPALQVRQVSTVTDAQGEYRLSGIPIGTYEVTYSLDGFQSHKREGVRLTAGFTAKIDVPLTVGSLQETITVSGSSPVVDVASTKPSTSLTREMLELIPTSRNGVQAMLAQAPGVRSNLDVGGNTAGAIPLFRAFGQVAGSWPVVEGVAISAPASAFSQPGIYLDYGGVEEAQVAAVGNDAETPTRGVLLNMVVKSGGNDYHGTFMSSYTHSSLVSNNIDAAMAAAGIRGLPILDRWDAGGDVSGRFVRDKLWFYGGIRGRVNDNGVLDCTKPEDGTPCATELTQRFNTIKTTYQLNTANRLIGYYQWNLKVNDTGASSLIAWGSRFHQDFTGNVGKAEWQGTPRGNVVANALVGFWNFDSLQTGYDRAPSALDIVTLKRWGSSSQSYFTPNNFIYAKYQIKGAVSWYAADSFLGDHNIKLGLDYIKGWDIIDAFSHETGDYILQFSNNVPFQVQVFNHPVQVRNDDKYTAVFLKDQWRMASRLTLNLGVRLAFDQAYVPAQSKVAGSFATIYPAASFDRVDLPAWNTVVPRLHAAYDLSNDGKTVVKGGWGRFAAIRGVDEANYVNPLVMSSTTFRWIDRNGNRDYDPGEANLDPDGPDFVSSTGFTQGILNPDERAPITDEFSLSVERQLLPDIAVRLTGIYSRDANVAQVFNPKIPYSAYTIPITNRDPGPDGIAGNADDTGTTITYWEYPSALRGRAFQAATRVNDPRLDRKYRSFELAVSKRLSNRWQAMAAYSLTKLHVPAQVANPNQGIFGDDNTTEWTAKVSGSYTLPHDVLASVNYELRNGAPWQRTHLFRGGAQIPTIVLPVEALGAQHYDNLHLLDGRVRKDFRFSKHKVAVGADIFNLLNLNTVTSITTRSGASYRAITTAGGNTTTLPFLPGRNVQFTLNYSF